MTATPTPDHAEWGFPNEATPLGSPAYYAVRFSPKPGRDLHAMLLAWFDLIQSIARSPTDPGVARLKLDWWRSEVHQALGDSQPRHPLTTCLCAAGLNGEATIPMQAVIDAAEQQIRHQQPSDATTFSEACHQAGGNLFVLMCQPTHPSAYNRERCLALGAYWDGMERLRRFASDPSIVPHDIRQDLEPTTDAATRQAGLAQLVTYPGSPSALRQEPVPDIVRRLVAGSQAFHHRVAKNGYTIDRHNVQRSPIANLWTAWRCRPSL